MIGIINYGTGNLRSVENALDRMRIPFFLSAHPSELVHAEKIIFPGVGHAKAAMATLRKKKLDIFLQQTSRPVLGICLGMQLMFDRSEEGNTTCLGIIPGNITKFDPKKCGKIPHMGWNDIHWKTKHSEPSTQSSSKKPISNYLYFVHSYFAPLSEYTIATCDYGAIFSAIVQKDNFTGMQFHPEKSGAVGERLLNNFVREKENNE